MRYKLKRNKNGILTQCENNADGNNIYTQREEINKLALENLQRPTPGKLGNLSNLQVFNFNISTIATGSTNFIFREYNETETTGNVTDCVMFNVDSINNKASYYNVVDVKINCLKNDPTRLIGESFVEFYVLENIEGSTTSLGRKMPRINPINGTSSGTVTFTTTGAKQEYQYISTQVQSDPVNIPNTLKGIRASGLALKTIYLNFDTSEARDSIELDVMVYVDVSSVSNSY